MSIHIIIDGYNLIRQSSELSALDRQDIQLGRKALVDMLAAYKKIKSHLITVVFDGTGATPHSQQRDRQKGISILYSAVGQTADAVIKKMAHREGPKALVVSSDQEIARSAASSGAVTMSANDFENKLAMSLYRDDAKIDRDENEGWKPTTKKKGPRRRLSKRQRTNRIKIRKL
jgi:predicted RNA-binding protein with PIN domain